MTEQPKRTVGLTGGIACGKSTVAGFFRELGVAIVDADQIAREIVAPKTSGLAEIIDTFGTEMLLPDGTLDRKRLGDLVFVDHAARQRLNAITHPRIASESARQLAALQESDAPYLMYEAALLIEGKLHSSFDALVVVTVSPLVQKQRLMARDQSNTAASQARIDAQMPLAEKEKLADYVIRNDGTREETRTQVLRIHEALLERFA